MSKDGDRIIVFSVRISVEAARRQALVASVRPLLEPTRVVPGCLACRLYEDFDDLNAFCMVFEWADRAALERFLRSDACKALLGAMEIGACRPEVHVDTIAEREGLEALALIRGY